MPNVSNLVKTIQDIMRKDAGTYGDAQRLEQLGWMFFLKIFDDREKEMELVRDNYKSPLPKHLRWSAWATDDEGITGEALLDFVDNTLLPKLKSLTGAGDKIAGLVRMAFEDANNYMKNGTLMRQVINKINGIDFNASDDRHMFGDIYEKLLKDLQSAGNAGEFYTPRAVTQFIVEQVNPRLGETILDPACGTGGFLVCAIEHLRKQAKTAAHERSIQDCFAGIDLKLDKLTHQDLGQMQMYVNHYDRQVKLPEENPTVGLLLCKEKKDAVVKLTLPKDANIHAREYQLYLPSKELLRAKLLEWAGESAKDEA